MKDAKGICTHCNKEFTYSNSYFYRPRVTCSQKCARAKLQKEGLFEGKAKRPYYMTEEEYEAAFLNCWPCVCGCNRYWAGFQKYN